MASVKDVQTIAQAQLDLALGKTRVNLGKLSESEFDNFLMKALQEVDLRELRDFKPLKDLVTFHRSDGMGWFSAGITNLDIKAGTTLTSSGLKDGDRIDLETHCQRVCRGELSHNVTIKRLETGEEAPDTETSISWLHNRQGYNYNGEASILLLRRPRNHSYAHENLFIVSYTYQKIPRKDQHEIVSIHAEHLPFASFRRHFGADYPRRAVELIWELRSAHYRTADQLESQAKAMRKKEQMFEKFSEVIWYE